MHFVRLGSTELPSLKRLIHAAMTLVLCGCLCGTARAQDPEILKSRVLASLRRSSIVGGGLGPYRIKGRIVIYDGAGKNPTEGSFEILRRDDRSLVAIEFPEASTVSLSTPAGIYNSSSGKIPYFAGKIVRVLQQPVLFNGFDAIPVMVPKQDEVAGRECISLVTTEKEIVQGPRTPLHAVCLDQPADQLRVVFDGNETYLRDVLVDFEQHEVAKQLRLRLGPIVIGEVEITKLESATISDAELTPSPEMHLTNSFPSRVPANVIAGRILQHETPKYPGVAKAAHIQGVVVLHAVISKDGHIQDLSVLTSPDPLLSEASLKAVRKWTYEPYVIDGEPTEVETTISVNFAMGHN